MFQQAHALKCDSELLVGKFCGEVSSYSWSTEFDVERHNVVVITAGLLVNLLDGREIKLDDVSLIMFDEVHT